jgi:thiol-disulfide isomerase/thioredoxin
MIKKILLGFALFGFIGCKSSYLNSKKNQSNIEVHNNDIVPEVLVGKVSVNDLKKEPYKSWFLSGIEIYEPNQFTIEKLEKFKSNINTTLIIGTWSEETRKYLPQFYKIKQKIGLPESSITIIGLDRGKKTPEKFEEKYNITHLPTFIFDINGKEIGRIVDHPLETLEKDMLKIFSGIPYFHSNER